MTSSQPTPSRAGMSAARQQQIRERLAALRAVSNGVEGVGSEYVSSPGLVFADLADMVAEADFQRSEVMRVAASLPRAWDERGAAEAERDLALKAAEELRAELATMRADADIRVQGAAMRAYQLRTWATKIAAKAARDEARQHDRRRREVAAMRDERDDAIARLDHMGQRYAAVLATAAEAAAHLDEERSAHAKTCANFEEYVGLDEDVSPGLIAALATPGDWHVYCPDGDDEPSLHHMCPGAPEDEGIDVGRPVDYTLAALLALAAGHVCKPADGGER